MSIPTRDKPDESAKRAAFISDLRAIADLLENEPRLPIPYMPLMNSFPVGDDAAKIAVVFQAAELLDTAVTFDQARGVCETEYRRGQIRYSVYASIGPQSPAGKVTVTSPDQILATTATIARPDLAEPKRTEHVPASADPTMCFTCGKPVTTDGGRCELGDRMQQAINGLDATVREQPPADAEPSAGARKVQECQRQLDELGESLERQGELLDEAAHTMRQAIAVHEELKAEPALVNGEQFPGDADPTVIHAAYYSPPGPGNSNRGMCNQYGRVTEDVPSVTCAACAALLLGGAPADAGGESA